MSNSTLAGQHALVTGGGSGIGLGCAIALATDGASVTLMGRTASRLESGAEALRAAVPGASVTTTVADAGDEDAVAAGVKAAADAGGDRLDIVVLSAGTGTLGPVVAMPLSGWNDVLTTNLTGVFLCIKHAAPVLAATGGGSIVAISSIAGALTHRHMAAYCVSKAGVEMLIKTAADELGPAGVRVNGVRPGLVPTELAGALAADPMVTDDYLAQMPVNRLGTVEDIAAGVRYLAGPESSWVTGQIFAIDGGHTLRRGPALDHWAVAMYGEDAALHAKPTR